LQLKDGESKGGNGKNSGATQATLVRLNEGSGDKIHLQTKKNAINALNNEEGSVLVSEEYNDEDTVEEEVAAPVTKQQAQSQGFSSLNEYGAPRLFRGQDSTKIDKDSSIKVNGVSLRRRVH